MSPMRKTMPALFLFATIVSCMEIDPSSEDGDEGEEYLVGGCVSPSCDEDDPGEGGDDDKYHTGQYEPGGCVDAPWKDGRKYYDPLEDNDAEPEDGVDPGSKWDHGAILIIYDKSGSMDAEWEWSTKWEVASEAMVTSLEIYKAKLTVGAVFFPQLGDCEVAELSSDRQLDFMPGPEFIDYWKEYSHRYPPEGNTPLEKAFEVADRAIMKACEDRMPVDRFQVMLLTDGEPNCETDEDNLLRWPARWLETGIETFVVGLPGSYQAKSLLDKIAIAGGTKNGFVPDDPEELEDELIKCPE